MTCAHDRTTACVLSFPFHEVQRSAVCSVLTSAHSSKRGSSMIRCRCRKQPRYANSTVCNHHTQYTVNHHCTQDNLCCPDSQTHRRSRDRCTIRPAAPATVQPQQETRFNHMPSAQTSSTTLHTSFMSAVSCSSSCCSAFCTCTTSPPAQQCTSRCHD